VAKHQIIGTAVGVVLFLLLLQLLPEVRCADGWASPSTGRQGACSHHGGVRGNNNWLFLILGASITAGIITAKYFKTDNLPPSFKRTLKETYNLSGPTDLIKSAIKSNKKIEFMYKKPTAYSPELRAIKPFVFKRVAHATGSTFCVVGHCELRKAQRTFALKRMSNIRVL
jgi:hypothetical protein